MPIKNQKIYPPYWKQFSEYIRFERAGNRCEGCKVENRSFTHRGTRVCLTVAHLDNDGGVCDCKERTGRKCAKPNHVLALCNSCHLRLDHPKHIARARETNQRKKDARRPLFTHETANA